MELESILANKKKKLEKIEIYSCEQTLLFKLGREYSRNDTDHEWYDKGKLVLNKGMYLKQSKTRKKNAIDERYYMSLTNSKRT